MEKIVKLESDGDTNCNWCSWYSRQRIGTRIGGLRNNRTSGDYPNYSIAKIVKNTVKSPGDLMRIAVNPTPERNHRITLMGKILKEYIIIIIIIFAQPSTCPRKCLA